MNIFKKAFILIIGVTFYSCNKNIYQNTNNSVKLNGWSYRKIAPSIKFYKENFGRFHEGKQCLNILDIDMNDPKIGIKIAYADGKLKKTSDFAKSQNAAIAINGSFFHPKQGGAVCYLKLDGRVITKSRIDLDDNYYINELDSAGIILDDNNLINIIARPDNGWDSLTTTPTILTAGPSLIINGSIQNHQIHSFNSTKFSRTGLGMTRKKHLIIVVADGNSEDSAGLTIAELTEVFAKLDCINAINLDGGGSSTMYIKGFPDNGIVNHPTDRKYYNSLGERSVADAIIISYPELK